MQPMRRFIIITSLFLVLAGTGFANPAAAGKVHPAVTQMKIVAAALVRAQKIGTRSAFRSVISKYADLPGIAIYSLGRYKSKLKRSRRSRYYRGVNAFMSRYFANESRKYRIVKTKIKSEVSTEGDNVVVNTRVGLASGSSYNVVWYLRKLGKIYKVTDVKVLGFSMTYLQRNMFSAYVRKKNGDVNELIVALNRHY